MLLHKLLRHVTLDWFLGRTGSNGRESVTAFNECVLHSDCVFRHYKGGLYTVVCVAKHHETSEIVVVYRSVDGGAYWARPLNGSRKDPDGWCTLVNGKPRFTCVIHGKD